MIFYNCCFIRKSNNNYKEEYNYLKFRPSQVQNYNYNLNTYLDQISEKEVRKFTQNYNSEINPIFSADNNKRNTISNLPFPNDSLNNDETSSNSDIIPQEFKIKKVTKIKPKIKDGLGYNKQNIYNLHNSTICTLVYLSFVLLHILPCLVLVFLFFH